jgi:NAD(P)-dependent dehydrogenase (short-subunit alcohol dehydrogenase family)
MTGKVAVITGASRGIGAGLVAAYRRRGWAVVASARTIKPSQDPDLLTVEGDIADPATADRIVGGALGLFGRIDTLVNNAGVFLAKPFTDYTAADYAAVTGVNLTGFFWLTRRAIAEMATRYGGHVVNVTATLAEVADSAAPAVLAALTKGGLAAATRSLAVEYASRGIRVNAVSPGIIQTPCTRWKAMSTSAAGCPRWAARPGQRRRGRHPVPRILALHHRRDPAHRRRPDRRQLRPPATPAGPSARIAPARRLVPGGSRCRAW